MVKDKIIHEGREVVLSWKESKAFPSGKVSQVSGYCFYRGRILIVKVNNRWVFPGGHPRKGEKPLETLRREVKEEANVSIGKARMIGYLEVDDPGCPGKFKKYFQLRFVADVKKVYPFFRKYESEKRKFVTLETLNKYIPWVDTPVVKAQLEKARRELRSFPQTRREECDDQ